MLEGNDMASGASNVVDSFVAYAMSLMSGLGETILYAMQLSYDSVIDFISSMVRELLCLNIPKHTMFL